MVAVDRVVDVNSYERVLGFSSGPGFIDPESDLRHTHHAVHHLHGHLRHAMPHGLVYLRTDVPRLSLRDDISMRCRLSIAHQCDRCRRAAVRLSGARHVQQWNVWTNGHEQAWRSPICRVRGRGREPHRSVRAASHAPLGAVLPAANGDAAGVYLDAARRGAGRRLEAMSTSGSGQHQGQLLHVSAGLRCRRRAHLR